MTYVTGASAIYSRTKVLCKGGDLQCYSAAHTELRVKPIGTEIMTSGVGREG